MGKGVVGTVVVVVGAAEVGAAVVGEVVVVGGVVVGVVDPPQALGAARMSHDLTSNLFIDLMYIYLACTICLHQLGCILPNSWPYCRLTILEEHYHSSSNLHHCRVH